MNFYKHHIGDYDADTAHLTWTEDAAYRRLICLYYRREQPVPTDITQACRLVRATSKQEREAVEAVLQEFFQSGPDGWRHKRCDGELDLASKQAEKNRANGKSGGRPRKLATEDEPSDNPQETQVVVGKTGVGNLIQTPDSRLQKKNPPATRVPPSAEASGDRPLTAKDLEAEGVDGAVARDWLKVRKAKKAPLTATAWDGVKREAALAGMSPAAAVKHATEMSWQGFKAAWLKPSATNGQTGADLFAGAR